ncbi:hypothetical protein [Crocosphaera sp.]|uniref:hypothetical protein n=1 Tax=Crocosphaera sp. TaxID=2729996 RepID=UPI003F1FF467|nr:hypothetical protein [Crocosphaera sp.]
MQTNPNALGESDLWNLNGNIDNLSRLVEQGISNSDVERIPHYIAKQLVGEYVKIVWWLGVSGSEALSVFC